MNNLIGNNFFENNPSKVLGDFSISDYMNKIIVKGSKEQVEQYFDKELGSQPKTKPMETETLDETIKKKFKHLSNQQLIDKANRAPDFGWDDEAYELERRKNASAGKFNFKMEGNKIVIIEGETEKSKSEYQKERERQLKAGEIKDDTEGISLYHLAKNIQTKTKPMAKTTEPPKKEIVKTEGQRVLSVEENIKKYTPELSDNDVKAFVWYNQTLGTPMTGWEKWFIKGTKDDTIRVTEDTEYLNQQFKPIGKFQKGDVIGKLTRFTHTYNGIPHVVVRKMDGQLVIVDSRAISSKSTVTATPEDLKPLILSHSLYYFNGDYVPLHIYSNTDFEILKTQLEVDKEFIIKNFGEIVYINNKCIIDYGMDCIAKEAFDAAEKRKAAEDATYKPKVISSRLMRVDAPLFQERFKLNPFSEISRETKTVIPNEDGEDQESTVTEAFINYVDSLKNSEFILISKSQFRSIIIYDYKERFAADDKEGKEKYKNVIANAQLECVRLFSNFCADILPTETKVALNRLINLTYNRSILINISKVPVGFICSSKFGLFDFILKPVQVEAFKFAVSRNNWCLALTVGFGKTSLCIALLSYYISSGSLKKPLIIVPKPVLTNWLKEMNGYWLDPKTKTVSFTEKPGYVQYYGIYSGCGFDIINLKNLDKRHRQLAPEVQKKKSVFTICTYEALEKMYIGDEDLRRFVIEEWKTILTGDRAETARSWAGKMLALESKLNQVDKNADIDIHALGFDSMFVDEAHRLKNMFVSVTADKTNKVSSSFSGSSSSRALRGFYVSMYLQKKGGRIGFLTATPFSNTPLEVYTMLCFLGYSELSKNNVNKITKFVELFFNETTEPSVDKDNRLVYNSVMKNYKNKPILNTLLCNTFLYKDNPIEAGVDRPCIVRYPRTDTKLMLKMSEVQKLQRDVLTGDFDAVQAVLQTTTDEQLKIYAEDLLSKYQQRIATVAVRSRGGSIVASSKISALSPFAGSPVSLSFITEERWSELYYNSPKIRFTVDAIANIMEFHKERQESNSSILIYCEVGLNILPYFKEALENICGFKRRISVNEDEDDEKNIFDEVEIIEGSALSDKEQNRRDAVCKLFNMGKVKVVIGTSTIKEGLNLQENCATLFILTPSWNSTDINQVEGRIHRQGNRFGYARVITPVVARSMDSFIYEKYDQKKSRLADIWKNDGIGDTEDLNIEIKAEKQKELILDNASEIAKIRADMYGLQKINIYNKAKEDYEAVRNAILKSGTFTELAAYHLDKTAPMLKLATTNLKLIKELLALIVRDEKKEQAVPTMVKRNKARLETLIEYYMQLIDSLTIADTSKKVVDIVNILSRSYNARNYYVSDNYDSIKETKEYLIKNKYKESEIDNLFAQDIFAKAQVFTKDTEEINDAQKESSLMELKKLYGASALAEKYILSPEGLSLTSPMEALQELVDRYKSKMETFRDDLKVNFTTNVSSDEDESDFDDENVRFKPKQAYLERLQKEAQIELDEENKLSKKSEELGNYFANETNVQLTYLKDDVDLAKCDVKKEACCDTNDYRVGKETIIEVEPEIITTTTTETNIEERNKILESRLKLLKKMAAKKPSDILKKRIKLLTKMLAKRLKQGGPVGTFKVGQTVYDRFENPYVIVQIREDGIVFAKDKTGEFQKPVPFEQNELSHDKMRQGGPVNRPTFAANKDHKYYNERQAYERRYAEDTGRTILKYKLKEGGPTAIDAEQFNSWRNGPGFTNAITELNTQDINYTGWTDMDIYVWYLTDDKMRKGGPVKGPMDYDYWRDVKILGHYEVKNKDIDTVIEIVGFENQNGREQHLYQPSDVRNETIGSIIVPNEKMRSLQKGQFMFFDTTTGLKVKIRRVAGRYFDDKGKPYAKPNLKTGGPVEDEGVDLFEDHENIPPDVQEILEAHEEGFMDGSYDELAIALSELEAIGYTFDYYLDGQAYDLRKIGEKGKAAVWVEKNEMRQGGQADKSKLATLTPEENRSWEKGFEFYLNEGKTDNQADKLAWKDLQMEFPRLKEFSGIKAEMRKGGPVSRPKFAIKKDRKYYNPVQRHERDYAKLVNRRKLRYRLKNGGPVGNETPAETKLIEKVVAFTKKRLDYANLHELVAQEFNGTTEQTGGDIYVTLIRINPNMVLGVTGESIVLYTVKDGSKMESYDIFDSEEGVENAILVIDFYDNSNLKHGGTVDGYMDLSKIKPGFVTEPTTIQKVDEIDIVKLGVLKYEGKNKISTSQDSANVFREFWNENSINTQEHFNVLLLNRSNKPIGIYQHSKGGISATFADVEMIASIAVKALASGVIVAHNHPSGNMQASEQDIRLTKQLKEALALLNIRLLDSIILMPDNNRYYSMADEGLMRKGGIVGAEGNGVFLSKDLSRSGEKPNKITGAHILSTWDKTEVGDDGETTLEYFINNSESGDTWQSGTEKLENIS